MSRNKKGYSLMRYKGVVKTGHIAFYEKYVGPIPEGLELDHLCKKRACVNPDHLEPVTHLENVRRGRATKVSPEEVQAIRESDLSRVELARKYKITDGYVRELQCHEARLVA